MKLYEYKFNYLDQLEVKVHNALENGNTIIINLPTRGDVEIKKAALDKLTGSYTNKMYSLSPNKTNEYLKLYAAKYDAAAAVHKKQYLEAIRRRDYILSNANLNEAAQNCAEKAFCDFTLLEIQDICKNHVCNEKCPLWYVDFDCELRNVNIPTQTINLVATKKEDPSNGKE